MNNFVHAITSSPDIAVIAEYKRASPSLGDINLTVTVEQAVQTYEKNGATCLSILTEPIKFKGDLDFIRRAKTVSNLPILRKDFITTPQQVHDTKEFGADAVLLIVANLTTQQLINLNTLAKDIGLDTLVEVHTLAELQQAIDCQPSMIGVNSRNLKTLKIDLTLFESLIVQIPDDVIVVAESGLHSSDLSRLEQLRYDAALIGTSLMRSL